MCATPASYWKQLSNGKIKCELCPHGCTLNDGQKGVCFVRQREGDQLILAAYGKGSSFCIDPVEKKPLHHFYPGSRVLSFGTAGCNLSCRFCQNWALSRSKDLDHMTVEVSPSQIAIAAQQQQCLGVALTYNEPIVFLEYGRDVILECKKRGIKTIAVTNGYINPEPREAFFPLLDAVNVDLKSFNHNFYKKLTGGSLAPVLETLKFIKNKTSTWLEITTLLIPGENDSTEEIKEMSHWILNNLGDEVPLHFSAFHPAYQMKETQPTPIETIIEAREIAIQVGLKFVYTGNVNFKQGDTTYCPNCHTALIQRNPFENMFPQLNAKGNCKICGLKIPGHFQTTEQ